MEEHGAQSLVHLPSLHKPIAVPQWEASCIDTLVLVPYPNHCPGSGLVMHMPVHLFLRRKSLEEAYSGSESGLRDIGRENPYRSLAPRVCTA